MSIATHTSEREDVRAPSASQPKRRWLARGTALLSVVALSFVAWASTVELDLERFASRPSSLSVVDRHGQLLRSVRGLGGVDARWVPLAELDRDLVDAVLAIEDARFYQHDGVDRYALARALVLDLVPGGRRSGASTITQQVVKLAYGRSSWLDKPREVVRALELERELTKDQILEQYLNRVVFASNVVGVERAAEAYFGHSARDLSLGEAALLAGLPRAPSVYDPRRHYDRAIARRGLVLARVEELGLRAPEVVAEARSSRPTVLAQSPRAYRAPRFVDRLLSDVSEGRLRTDGVRLATTLDLTVQTAAESELRASLSRLAGRGAENAASLVLDLATGDVLAYVGAARGAELGGSALDLLRAPRQPGSTLKPFAYELFFERGAGPATLVDDVAFDITGHRGAFFEARNFDRHERGPVRARVALAASLNLAALDVVRRLGDEAFVTRLASIGFSRVGDAERHGAAAVLGGVDVTPVELALAYAALARGGVSLELALVPRPLSNEVRGARLFDAEAAALVTDVLADADARRAGFGRDLTELYPEATFALKTGTSQGFRDAWCVAYDARHLVLVWYGDPEGRPMREVSGFEAAAPSAVRILAATHRATASPDVTPTTLGTALPSVRVCAASGLAPGPHCPSTVLEPTHAHAPLLAPCPLHTDGSGRRALTGRYAAWADRTRAADVDIVATEGARPTVTIVRPVADAMWMLRGAGLPVVVHVDGVPRGDVTLELDGVPVRAIDASPSSGEHTLVASYEGVRSAPVRFSVSRGDAR